MGLLVYSASAGSGKTYTLALKYIAMAVATDRASDFTNILAVTFTNMATAEMKDRILKQLDNLARGGTDKDFLENLIKETQISKDVLVRRAKGVLAAIMHDYDHFRVETIDSFFQTLLTNLAHELKLPRGFKVDLDDKAVVSQSVDRMLLGVGNEANADLTSMIISVLERHIDDDKGWNIAKELKRFAQSNLFRGEYMAHDEEIEEVTSDSKYMGRLHHALRSYIRDFDEKLEDCIARIEPEVEAVAGVKSKATNIRTYEKNLRKHDFSEPAKIIVTMAGNWDAVFNKDCKEKEALRGHAQRISDILKEMEYLRETYASSVYNCELTLKNLDRLSLSGAISREITRYTTEHETFLLARTPELFNRMVKGNDASFVFEKYGTTFKHIMIDEFQDTSRMQWNNFKTLLLENMAQGDESMLVGDIKQSIYRWRGGDWNILFDIKKEFDQADVLPKVENFRSLPVIVRFNNAFFVKASTYIDKRHWEVPGDWICHETKLMPVLPEEVDNSNIIQQIYKDVEQTPRCGEEGTGYVRIVMNDKDTTAEETIEDLYEQAVNLHVEHGVPYGEMLILVRRNSETQTIIDYITEKDPAFPITSAEAFMLKSSLMVTTLINALKFLSDKTDTLAMALLREGLHAIYDKIEDKELRNFYLDMIDGICTTLSDDAQRATMQQMPLYELCLHLMMMMHYEEAEKLGELKQSAYIFNFLDALVSYINDHSSDIKDFISFWDDVLSERSIAVNVEDAVRVMTIHKAKGLEGHTVFIPFADFLLENSQHDKIIWCAPQQNMTNDTNVNELVGRLPLVPVNDLKKMEESAYSTFYENEHRQQRVDSLNTLYVAFTRAKCNLFIWSKRPKIGGRSAFNLIDAFVNNLQPSDEKTTTPGVVCYGNIVGAKGTKEAKDEQDTKEISVSISHNDLSGVKFFQSSKALDFLADSEREIEGDTPELQHQRRTRYFMNKGTLYHQVFSLIERKEDVPGVIEKMRAEGLLATKKQADEILTFVTTALQQEKETAKWFDGTYELYNEHNILIRSDGHAKMFRPDRVMVAADHAVVVDYKFGSEKEEYKDQVEMYANNLAKLLNKPVKGYLWYVSKKVIPVCDIELNIK
ncbi:UvrD-helicase domain-containing protein [Prevotellamassilia timonensis]|jgi:ATP-dependent helicase/nuclease subunit A|uniref:UvrD-helicase domain-containing protein n=1 Tax=Prevotellamassilia timonensis TaxID=1852370 RepID=UPI00033B01D7|nr:uvrD/REP helicase domain protein [Prevotella sp. CAG:5226]